jgi:hypothetical protein
MATSLQWITSDQCLNDNFYSSDDLICLHDIHCNNTSAEGSLIPSIFRALEPKSLCWLLPFLITKLSGELALHLRWMGPSWPWSYGSLIYYYLCNQCLSPLMWIRISIRARCTTLCDRDCQWLATGQWFPPPINLTANDITLLLKVALNTIKQTNIQDGQGFWLVKNWKSLNIFFRTLCMEWNKSGLVVFLQKCIWWTTPLSYMTVSHSNTRTVKQMVH